MRITNLLAAWYAPGKGRSAQPVDKVPFQEILPLKLKDRVSGKYDKAKEGGCLYEMSLVIACLQEHAYENKFCQKQVEMFSNCFKKYLADKRESKLARQKGVLVSGERKLTHKQIQKLFKMRPIV